MKPKHKKPERERLMNCLDGALHVFEDHRLGPDQGCNRLEAFLAARSTFARAAFGDTKYADLLGPKGRG